MKILYYDCFSGISGDMNLGAFIDLGVDKDYLIGELAKLSVCEYGIKVTRDIRKGISGTRVDVLTGESHHHRNMNDIREIINKSSLSENVKRISMDIFLKVAEAEAKVHGKSIEEIHFHEVGAVDSIVDIIGAAICFDFIKPDMVLSSPVETGSGFVKCAHGILPVPAPATAEILRGIPLKSMGIPFEATTPTGAAILSAFTNKFTEKKDFMINKIGYGIGHKDEGDVPNVLRVFLGEAFRKLEPQSDIINERAIMIECNIDDMNPENYEYIMEKIFDQGIMDAYLTPIIMKKGRPAVKISVLCSTKRIGEVEKLLLSETSTLGVRRYEVDKDMLKRENCIIDTSFGSIRIKNAYYGGKMIKSKPEYDDCRKIALEKGIPLIEVYEQIKKEIEHIKS